MIPPKGTWFINRWLLIAIVLAIGVLIIVLINLPTHVQGKLNCTQLADEGISNIQKGDKNYHTYLDGDRDGVACER